MTHYSNGITGCQGLIIGKNQGVGKYLHNIYNTELKQLLRKILKKKKKKKKYSDIC